MLIFHNIIYIYPKCLVNGFHYLAGWVAAHRIPVGHSSLGIETLLYKPIALHIFHYITRSKYIMSRLSSLTTAVETVETVELSSLTA